MKVTDRRSCSLCGETANRPFLLTSVRSSSGEHYGVVTCAACSLRYTNPLPNDEELNHLYEEEYYEYAYDRLCDDAKVAARNPGWFNLQSLTLLFKTVLFAERRRALLGRQPGRVLDVGCGNGDFLQSLKRASPKSKMLFLALGLPVALLCLPYSALETKVRGNGENLTITAGKAAG